MDVGACSDFGTQVKQEHISFLSWALYTTSFCFQWMEVIWSNRKRQQALNLIFIVVDRSNIKTDFYFRVFFVPRITQWIHSADYLAGLEISAPHIWSRKQQKSKEVMGLILKVFTTLLYHTDCWVSTCCVVIRYWLFGNQWCFFSGLFLS